MNHSSAGIGANIEWSRNGYFVLGPLVGITFAVTKG